MSIWRTQYCITLEYGRYLQTITELREAACKVEMLISIALRLLY